MEGCSKCEYNYQPTKKTFFALIGWDPELSKLISGQPPVDTSSTAFPPKYLYCNKTQDNYAFKFESHQTTIKKCSLSMQGCD